MHTGYFYFIKNTYYQKFKNCGIMKNKYDDIFEEHRRPCYYCFKYGVFYWMIPISSQIEKYEKIYNKKINKYPNYDGIRFGYVNGKKRAFLIQNIFPVTEKYLDEIYTIEKGKTTVTISPELRSELNKLARKVIRLNEKGIRIVLTNLNYIIEELNKEQ